MTKTKWPLGKVIQMFSGEDDLVGVANVKMHEGIFKRPICKLALLLPTETKLIVTSHLKIGFSVS